MNIIIFSKNRGLQLDLLIRSFNFHVKHSEKYTLNVLYTYIDDNFKNGYGLLMKKYPNVNFIKETIFKKDVLSLIDNEEKYTTFFVDDDIFKNGVDLYDDQETIFSESDNILCRSLRIHENLKRCYSMDFTYNKIPIFNKVNNSIIYDWAGQEGDYGYPMSLDGHIFKTLDILPFLTSLNYINPNTLEGNLAHNQVTNQINKPKIICYEKSIIFNNPCNMVNISTNLHGNEDINRLNNEYLNGKIISMSNTNGIDNISCHQEIKIILE